MPSNLKGEDISKIAEKTNPQIMDIALKDEERQPCEVWTRVMGYHRPTASFNIGKKGEFRERKFFNEARAAIFNG